MEIQGTLKAVQPIVEREIFKSRKVWLTVAENPEYPQTIEVEVNQAKIDLFAGVTVGASVICHVNLRGREWTGADGITKVFNTIVCWKVIANGTAAGPAATPVAQPQAPALPDLDSSLPF